MIFPMAWTKHNRDPLKLDWSAVIDVSELRKTMINLDKGIETWWTAMFDTLPNNSYKKQIKGAF